MFSRSDPGRPGILNGYPEICDGSGGSMPKKSNYMKQADTAFSKYIRARDKQCQAAPPHAGNLQCAHIISRSYKAIRTDPDNAIALCAKHHVFYTHRPLEWEEWVTKRFPGRLGVLRKRALGYGRMDWKAEAAYWKLQLEGTDS